MSKDASTSVLQLAPQTFKKYGYTPQRFLYFFFFFFCFDIEENGYSKGKAKHLNQENLLQYDQFLHLSTIKQELVKFNVTSMKRLREYIN